MTVSVRVPALFADRIDGVSTIAVPGFTVQEALHAVAARYPELRRLMLRADGEINPMMVVFLNNDQLSAVQLTTTVGDGDEIEIIPAIAGGSPSD